MCRGREPNAFGAALYESGQGPRSPTPGKASQRKDHFGWSRRGWGIDLGPRGSCDRKRARSQGHAGTIIAGGAVTNGCKRGRVLFCSARVRGGRRIGPRQDPAAREENVLSHEPPGAPEGVVWANGYVSHGERREGLAPLALPPNAVRGIAVEGYSPRRHCGHFWARMAGSASESARPLEERTKVQDESIA